MARETRCIRIEGDIAYVPLTKGYEAVIDAEDVPLVSGASWRAAVGKWAVYAIRNHSDGELKTTISMHRLIMGAPVGLEVDHRDGNGLNNRRHGETGNLRVATTSQNQFNQRVSVANSSGFKGVTLVKSLGKWQAQIRHGKARRYLGLHATKEAAHAAYCAASLELHGEFRRLA